MLEELVFKLLILVAIADEDAKAHPVVSGATAQRETPARSSLGFSSNPTFSCGV